MSSQEFWGTNCTAQVQIQHQYSHILPSKQVELHEKCIYSCKRSFGIGEIFFFCANFKKKGLWKYSRKMDHQQLQWAPWNLTSSGSFIERLAFLASRAAHYEAWGCASVISRLGGFDGELVLIKWNLKCMLISHLRDKNTKDIKGQWCVQFICEYSPQACRLHTLSYGLSPHEKGPVTAVAIYSLWRLAILSACRYILFFAVKI